MSETLAGRLVAETWELESLIGRGGMGEVWLARHRRVEGKQAAVKVMRTMGALNPELLLRFRREAEIAARLEHPNIIHLFDFATLPSGEPYLVMEYLRGESLKSRLARGPMSWDTLRPLAVQLCSALHTAHERDVVHRDLKPENIFLVPTPTGDQVKVLDFGISKVLGSDTMQTGNSVLIGTPLYMSPEQAMSQNDTLDGRSDIFSFASIVYEALSGRAAFAASGVAQVVHRVVFVEPEPLPQVLPHVWAALAHAFAKDPAHRTPDVATLVLELTGKPLSESSNIAPAAPVSSPRMHAETVAQKASSQTRAPQVKKPFNVVPWLVAGIVLVGLASGGVLWRKSQHVEAAAVSVVVDAGVQPVVAVEPAVVPEPPRDEDEEVDAGVAVAVAVEETPTRVVVAKPEPPQSDAQREQLTLIEAAFEAQRYAEVLNLTVKPDVASLPRAMRWRVMAACALGNVALVSSLRPRMSAKEVGAARSFCRRHDVTL